MMFFQSETIKMWRSGELSTVAISGWKSRANFHPITGEIAERITFIIAFPAYFFSLLLFGLLDLNHGSAPSWTMVGFCIASGFMVISLGLTWRTLNHDNFLRHYLEICSLIGSTPSDVAKLQAPDLRARVRNGLCERGQRLVDAERTYGVYSKEQAEAKRTFEEGYESCLQLALIDNEGYRVFIPNMK